MTLYQRHIARIQQSLYTNDQQLQGVIATRRHILNHYDSDLNLEVLAELRHTSRFHLLRLFKRYYGQTPRQFLTEIRIQKAKEFLSAGHSVTDTCFKVGFSSMGSFSTLFSNRVGMPPSRFRKSQLSRSTAAK